MICYPRFVFQSLNHLSDLLSYMGVNYVGGEEKIKFLIWGKGCESNMRRHYFNYY